MRFDEELINTYFKQCHWMYVLGVKKSHLNTVNWHYIANSAFPKIFISLVPSTPTAKIVNVYPAYEVSVLSSSDPQKMFVLYSGSWKLTLEVFDWDDERVE